MHPENVLPLYDTPAHPDAWHRVAAPGGYEWWRFDAEDAAGKVRVVATLFDGFPFHPGYLRRYRRYLRGPTRHRPPQAVEYPCVALAVFEEGKPAVQVVTRYPPGAFSASTERPDVRIGSTTFRRDEDGALHLKMPESSTELTFRAMSDDPPREQAFPSQGTAGSVHRWVISNPLCEVDGTVRLGVDGNVTRFTGLGCVDHQYGTEPVGHGLRRWFRGRILGGERRALFQVAQPSDPSLPDEGRLVMADARGAGPVVADSSVTADWSRRNQTGLAYPREVAFANGLRLSSPRVVGSTPYSLCVAYDTQFAGDIGRAFCDVVYPRRLTWPGVGRLVERSIRQAAPAVTPHAAAAAAP